MSRIHEVVHRAKLDLKLYQYPDIHSSLRGTLLSMNVKLTNEEFDQVIAIMAQTPRGLRLQLSSSR